MGSCSEMNASVEKLNGIITRKIISDQRIYLNDGDAFEYTIEIMAIITKNTPICHVVCINPVDM